MSVTFKKKLEFNFIRFLRFLRALFKQKKGIVGFTILIVFLILALVPHWFTPYHPTKTEGLAGSMAAPSWIKYLPGVKGYCENIYLTEDPGFSRISTLKEFDINATAFGRVYLGYSHTMGYPYAYGGGPGCIFINYVRTRASPGNTSVFLTKKLAYPYDASPERFSGDIAFFIEGSVKRIVNDRPILDVPVSITFFVINGENKRFNLWRASEQPIETPSVDWVSTRASKESVISVLDSRSTYLKEVMYGYVLDNATGQLKPYWHFYSVTPEEDIFGNFPQNLTIGLEILFIDKGGEENAEVTLYLDGLQFRTLGKAWGLLGTDKLGRDLFTQLVYGVRVSLYVGVLASVLGVIIGLVVGLAAGYLGKVVDEVLMRFADMLLVIPGLPLLIVLVAVLGASLNNLIILLGFLGWMGFSRVVRSQVLSLRERPFVEAAKAAGGGSFYIMFRHIVPNVMALVYVTLATSVPGAVVAEASLSWLGFFDPNVMSWGRMLHDAQVELAAFDKWWWILPPGLCIAALALSFILIGFSLDEVLNPRLRERK